MSRQQHFFSSAELTMHQWAGFVLAALFALAGIFLGLALLNPGPDGGGAGNWLGAGGAFLSEVLYYRFGRLAWMLPLACLLALLMILRGRAFNSLFLMCSGIIWSMMCLSCLLGMYGSAADSGQTGTWSGPGGRELALSLEAQLGGWASILLLLNFCLLGLLGICLSVLPWLWNWNKNRESGPEALDEQELMRQAILQGVRDAARQTGEDPPDPRRHPYAPEWNYPMNEPAYGHEDGEPVSPGLAAAEDFRDIAVDIAIDSHPGETVPALEPPAFMFIPGPAPAEPAASAGRDRMIFSAYPQAPLPGEEDEEQRREEIGLGLEEEIGLGLEEEGGGEEYDSGGEEEETGIPSAVPAYPGAEEEEASAPCILPCPEPSAEASAPRILPRQDGPVAQESGQALTETEIGYQLPALELLQVPAGVRAATHNDILAENSRLLQEKLANFGVQGQVMEVAPGPVVTMYEFKPAPGVKISKVSGLSDDLAMNLKAASVRIVAPIPGKSVIGIEIPSPEREVVYLRELLASEEYRRSQSPLTVALGKNILGRPVVSDLSRMPHLLIAGATGAGKSVFINTLILSILYRATPQQARLLMVDPKRIELSAYNDIPHLLYPVITHPKEATAGLRWAVAEMERRYDLLAEKGVRNIASYNQKITSWGDGEILPYILIIIDELADLMMVASKEVETLITRLAQMARAAGIHLALATQRPSVDVITGLIKANFPARLSFQVSSRIDSRTILDTQGAENLLGAGDMLFLPPGTSGLVRLHGAFVSDEEIEKVADFVKGQASPQYDEAIVRSPDEDEDNGGEEEEDQRYGDAVLLVQQSGQASISYVQRRLRVGYNRAARMIEQMEREGIVGPSDGSRPREVLKRQ
ncbi:MAG: DNA translocase FtsK [Desulfarculales bacterium]|jgi:S-DNA-T family DNA segregation ATPase FtsK/SpoIIIE|nr:DNA translocase FtsK [Desulfarculales bacterium]